MQDIETPTTSLLEQSLSKKLRFKDEEKPKTEAELAKPKPLKTTQIKQVLRGRLSWKGMPEVPKREELLKSKAARRRQLLIMGNFAAQLVAEKRRAERAEFGYALTPLHFNPLVRE